LSAVDAAVNGSWLAGAAVNNSVPMNPTRLPNATTSLRLVVTVAIMVCAALCGWLVAKLLNCYLARAPLPSNGDTDSEMSEHTVRLLRLQRQRGRQLQLSEVEKANFHSVVVDMWRQRPHSLDLNELHGGGDSALQRLRSAWRQLRPLDEVEGEDKSGEPDQSIELERQRRLSLLVQRLGEAWLAASRGTAQLEVSEGPLGEAQAVDKAEDVEQAEAVLVTPAKVTNNTNYGLEAVPEESPELTSDVAETVETGFLGRWTCSLM
ncbi:hypothetical protein BOX15_Mlig023283g1, partial [Macrostomum lignano]